MSPKGKSNSNSERKSDRIKGNVNDNGEKIQHAPGSRYYDRTKVNPERGGSLV